MDRIHRRYHGVCIAFILKKNYFFGPRQASRWSLWTTNKRRVLAPLHARGLLPSAPQPLAAESIGVAENAAVRIGALILLRELFVVQLKFTDGLAFLVASLQVVVQAATPSTQPMRAPQLLRRTSTHVWQASSCAAGEDGSCASGRHMLTRATCYGRHRRHAGAGPSGLTSTCSEIEAGGDAPGGAACYRSATYPLTARTPTTLNSRRRGGHDPSTPEPRAARSHGLVGRAARACPPFTTGR